MRRPALEHREQSRRQRVDILRIQALDDGFESTEEQVEIQRGCGAGFGDLGPRCQPTGRARAVEKFEIAVSHQVEIAHRESGALGEHHLVVRIKVHYHLVVGAQRHAGDRTDPDSGYPHGITCAQT